eukprot:775611-Pleurochrysis_carterae.AAC.1
MLQKKAMASPQMSAQGVQSTQVLAVNKWAGNTPECDPLALPSISWPCGNAMKPLAAREGNSCIRSFEWCVERVQADDPKHAIQPVRDSIAV